jgi:hypothetical protein
MGRNILKIPRLDLPAQGNNHRLINLITGTNTNWTQLSAESGHRGIAGRNVLREVSQVATLAYVREALVLRFC